MQDDIKIDALLMFLLLFFYIFSLLRAASAKVTEPTDFTEI